MGHIHGQHGRIAVETRGDFGFIIHAGYGFRARRCKLRDVSAGKKFRMLGEDANYRVKAVKEQTATIRRLDSGWEGDWSLSADVEVPDEEEFDETSPLAKAWNGEDATGHPEFLREDLDDLIEALKEARDA